MIGLSGASYSVGATQTGARDGSGGEKPNENVPATEVGALQVNNSEVPAGNWITAYNGWCDNPETEYSLRELLDETHQIYTVDGDEFVLESADDWDVTDDGKCDGVSGAYISHTIPPKPPGTTFEITWEASGDTDKFPPLGNFPARNEITVTQNQGNGK